jgi:hypothetical protein
MEGALAGAVNEPQSGELGPIGRPLASRVCPEVWLPLAFLSVQFTEHVWKEASDHPKREERKRTRDMREAIKYSNFQSRETETMSTNYETGLRG